MAVIFFSGNGGPEAEALKLELSQLSVKRMRRTANMNMPTLCLQGSLSLPEQFSSP